jgi:hypothetical protein
MNNLVQKLTNGDHPVVVSLRPSRTVQAFKSALDRGYIHIKFTETQGGTELGFPVDKGQIELAQADFESGRGHVHVTGDLTLDYERVRCVADIELETLEGYGHLELLATEAASKI